MLLFMYPGAYWLSSTPQLGWPFFEGDNFHPQENIEKMARGEPLTDQVSTPVDLRLLLSFMSFSSFEAWKLCVDPTCKTDLLKPGFWVLSVLVACFSDLEQNKTPQVGRTLRSSRPILMPDRSSTIHLSFFFFPSVFISSLWLSTYDIKGTLQTTAWLSARGSVEANKWRPANVWQRVAGSRVQ